MSPKPPGIWQTYDSTNGLRAGVKDITQDQAGVLWLGTYGSGLCRYDGVEFTYYTTEQGLTDNTIDVVLVDAEDRIWLQQWNGEVVSFDGETFTHHTAPNGSLPEGEYAIPTGDAEGTIWVFTSNGQLYRFEEDQFIPTLRNPIPAQGGLNRFFQDRQGRFWVGTRDGARCYEGQSMRLYTTQDGLIDNRVLAFCEDGEGRIWIGVETGLSCFDGTSFTSYTRPDAFPYKEIHMLYTDTRHRIWVGAASLLLFDGEAFVQYAPEDGLLDTEVKNIYEDRDGRLWFCHPFTGVSSFEPQAFHQLTSDFVGLDKCTQDPEGRVWYGTFDHLGCIKQGRLSLQPASSNVMQILPDRKGGLWVGTWGRGIFYYPDRSTAAESTPIRYTVTEGLTDLRIQAMMIDHDDCVWAAVEQGDVFRFDGDVFRSISQTPQMVDAVLQPPYGPLWIGSYAGGGLIRIGGHGRTISRPQGLPEADVRLLLQDRGRSGAVWMEHPVYGLVRIPGAPNRTVMPEDGLPANAASTFLESRDGALWIGTFGGGLIRYIGDQKIEYGLADGLEGTMITCICEDRHGHLWFGTEAGGLYRYDGRNFQMLNRQDGLPASSVTGIAQQADGAMIIATKGGVVRYAPDQSRPPPISILRLVADQTYSANTSIALTTVSARRIVFRFRGVSLDTGRLRYNYRLAGYDSDWQWTWQESVVYENLQAGEYRFEVVAINRDLKYSDPPAVVSLTVRPDPRDTRITTLEHEVEHLRQAISRKYEFEHILGQSPAMERVYAMVERAIETNLTVLLSGETGTGKELVARAIHHHSPRTDGPFQELNCGAMPQELIGALLFGYRKGAFTGADENTAGLFESANGGTMMLDEIGEMSMDAQVHLLRVLQEKTFQRIGETTLREVDVRVIAVTNRDLNADVKNGTFREDLYYRLSVFPIHLPPLRERLEDIPMLAEHFLNKAREDFEHAVTRISSETLDLLASYAWPGNVRELENEMQRAVALAYGDTELQSHHLSARLRRAADHAEIPSAGRESFQDAMNRTRRQILTDTLRAAGGNRAEAARRLGLYRSNLVVMLKRLGIE